MPGIELCKVDEVSPTSPFSVDLGDLKIMVVRTGDSYLVTDRICTHRQVDLVKEGHFDEETGFHTCLRHGSAFELETGEALNPPAINPLTVYTVSVEDGVIFVEVN